MKSGVYERETMTVGRADLGAIQDRASETEESAVLLRSESRVCRNSGDPFVSMMKATDLWNRHDLSR